MNSSTSSFSARACVLSLLVCAAVIACVELACPWLVATYSTNETYQFYRHQRRQALHAQADILLLGDSTMRSAVDPRAFERAAALSALNLATTSASGLMSDYYQLADYLERHTPPRAVVVMHSFNVWDQELHFDLYQLHFARGAETVALCNAGLLNVTQSARALLGSAFPSVRLQPYARALLLPALQGDFARYDAMRAKVAAFLAQREALGYLPDDVEFIHSDTTVQRELAAWRATPFAISDANDFFLRRLLQLAARRGIFVYFAHPPLYRPLAEQCERTQFVRELNAFLQSHTNERVALPDGGFFACDTRELGHAVNHLNARGAQRYSAHLGGRVQATLSSANAEK